MIKPERPKRLTERFLKTYDIGSTPEFNSVRFIDVKTRIKPPEEIPPAPGLWKSLMARIR